MANFQTPLAAIEGMTRGVRLSRVNDGTALSRVDSSPRGLVLGEVPESFHGVYSIVTPS